MKEKKSQNRSAHVDWSLQREGIEKEILRRATFDKIIMILASGGLLISLGFIKNMIRSPFEGSIFYLEISWLAFAICILFTVISFFYGAELARVERTVISGEERNIVKGMATIEKQLSAARTFSIASLFSFMTAIFLTIIFAGINVQIINVEPDRPKKTLQRVEEQRPDGVWHYAQLRGSRMTAIKAASGAPGAT